MLPQNMRLMTLSMDINTINGWFLNKNESPGSGWDDANYMN